MDKLDPRYIIAVVAAWALRELFSLFKSDSKRNTEATLQNTLALIELKVEISHLKASLMSMPKMRSDIDAAHSKIREMLAVQTGLMGDNGHDS